MPEAQQKQPTQSQEGSQQPTDGGPSQQQSQQSDQQSDQTFTQADVDRIVADRLKREREATKAKYGDYNDLKAKAEGAKTLEERIAEVEKRATDAEANALRANIANAHGISTEDRDLFLTGMDEETLTAQAKRLAQRDADQKKKGPIAPGAGRTPTQPQGPDEGKRELVRNLFGRTD